MPGRALRRTLPPALMLSAVLAAAGPVAAEQWLRLEVYDRDDRERVEINLPVTMVEKMIAMTPRKLRLHEVVKVNGVRLGGGELTRLVAEARALRPGEVAHAKINRRRVEVRREGSTVRLKAPSHRWWQNDVEVRMPLEVAAALAGRGGRDLDLAAGLAAMARHGESGVVVVEGRDGTTEARLWVGGAAGGERGD